MEEIRRIRKERGLTQDQLAEVSHVDQSTLSQIETGRRTPGVETLQKLADALGVEVADFFPRSQPDLFTTAPLPQVDLAAMWRATPGQRRRALAEASDDEVRRYRQSIDRALDNLKKWEAGEDGYTEQDRKALAAQRTLLLALRAETDPSDVVPSTKEQRAAHASVGAA
jgi:transcriptional regulator with XRE-family HTH domain